MLTANRIQRLLDAVSQPALEAFSLASLFATPWGGSLRAATSEQGVLLEFDLPGHTQNDISIHAEGQRLSVEVKGRANQDLPAEQFRVRERQGEVGTAEFQLPFSIHPDLTDVVYQNGVLQISIRKPAEAQKRTIAIRGGETN